MTLRQQQTLKWAALLHDISKRGEPEFKGRDHTHPFAGGLALLKIFDRLGFLEADLGEGKEINRDNLETVYSLIENSMRAPLQESSDPTYGKRFKKKERYCETVHSHRHL